ncbi:MAG: tetratricopeptide repeat protein [Gemmatimonadota bacterium]
MTPFPSPAVLLVATVLLAWTAGSGVGQEVPRPAGSCPVQANPFAAAGWEAYQAGEIPTARRAFQDALDLCPRHLGAGIGMGYVELREDDVAQATQRFRMALEQAPDNIDALIGAGLAAWRQARLDDVALHFLRVEGLDPGNATARQYLEQLPEGVGPPPERPPLVLPDSLVLTGRVAGRRLQVPGAQGWEDFWVKGMNLGAALPGRNPSEFPGRETYDYWLEEMAGMNVNTIRVYTVHPPAFYESLRAYNLRNPDAPLRLLHGVWTELPPDDDFRGPEFEEAFFGEMRRVVDLLHGRADIRPRPGHASGFYTADVSQWTLGYIIGREWEPHAVLAFDSIHPELREFQGEFVEVSGGNAMDAWLGGAVDTLVAYETRSYKTQRPVAWTNWPTLDPLHHPTESSRAEEVALRRARGEEVVVEPREYDNDVISVDPSLLRPTPAFPAGTFAAYHVYPYYPDLLIHSDRYAESGSSGGPSHYMGYLRELLAHHHDIPVVIAEYGVPTSLGPAHLQPQGWHHGGHTEAEMAEINRRLTLELAEAGAAGGALFAWIDEWFKKNWLVIEFELPPERNLYWLNRLDAEQQYGMLAKEAVPPIHGSSLQDRLPEWRTLEPLHASPELTIRAAHDAAFLWLLVETPQRENGDRVMVGLDILDPEGGGRRWPGGLGPELPVGVEFVLVDDGSEARVLAHPAQNPYRLVPVGQGGAGPTVPPMEVENPPAGLFHQRVEMRINAPFATPTTWTGVYDTLNVVANRRRLGRDGTEFLAVGYDRGLLREGPPPDGLVDRAPGVVEVRIPWLLVNITDPSSRSVLHTPGGDPDWVERDVDGRVVYPPEGWVPADTSRTPLSWKVVDDIGVVAGLERRDGSWVSGWTESAPRFTWPTWDEPEWRVRRRPVWDAMRRTFQEVGYGTAAGEGGEPSSSPPGQAEPETAVEDLSTLDPDTLQARANQAWIDGRPDEAERLYLRILEADPHDTRALHRLALAAAWEGSTQEGMEYLDRLLELEPENVDAAVDRARFQAWEGDLQGALAELDELEARFPDHPRVLEEQARVLGWSGDHSGAVSIYDDLVGILPGDRDLHLGRAQALVFGDRLQEAVRQYEEVLADSPEDIQALQGKGRALAWMGRLVDAEKVLRRAVVLAPADVDVRVGLAQVLRWQGRNVAAREEVQEAEGLAPGRGDVAEQRRWIDVALNGAGRVGFAAEGDSDGNRMNTLSLSATAPALGRLTVRGDAYRRFLAQGELDNGADGGQLSASFLLEPGWTVSAGVGRSRGAGDTELTTGQVGVASPGRYPVVLSLSWSRTALDATAVLAERVVTVDGWEAGLRWSPAPGWNLSGGGGRAVFQGSEENLRHHASLAVGRRVGSRWTLGVAGRYFGFREDLTDGYFDPSRFQLVEITGRWLAERGSWSFLLEGAPGVQRIRTAAPAGSARISSRLTYRFAPGRKVYLGGGFSNAGLQSFAGDGEYRYHALLAGVQWVP